LEKAQIALRNAKAEYEVPMKFGYDAFFLPKNQEADRLGLIDQLKAKSGSISGRKVELKERADGTSSAGPGQGRLFHPDKLADLKFRFWKFGRDNPASTFANSEYEHQLCLLKESKYEVGY